MGSDSELDRLTQLLRQCLGRIDEAAFRFQTDDGEVDHETSIEQLGLETGQLQELVTSLIDAASKTPETFATDLNKIVHRAVQESLHQCAAPVVMRSRLASRLAGVSCQPSQVAHAVQRALQLGIGHAGHGGAVEACTRQEGEQAIFELTAEGQGNPETLGRAATLAEFVASLGGRCRIDEDETGVLLLLLELPTADVLDDRQFD